LEKGGIRRPEETGSSVSKKVYSIRKSLSPRGTDKGKGNFHLSGTRWSNRGGRKQVIASAENKNRSKRKERSSRIIGKKSQAKRDFRGSSTQWPKRPVERKGAISRGGQGGRTMQERDSDRKGDREEYSRENSQ